MLVNIIKTAIRNLMKRKVFSIVNLLGLVIGITSCILILLWVKDEISYDRFHIGYQNIYRVGEMQKQGDDLFPVGVTPAPLGPALVDNFPEIEDFVRIQSGVHGVMSYEDRVFREKGIILADSSFFNVFGFDLIMGNAEDVLSDPYSIVISDKIARKYFGDEDPVGKVLKYENAVDQKVSGVFAERKENSHMLFDFVVPIKLLEMFGRDLQTSWSSNSYYTYVVLNKNSNQDEVSNKITDFLAEQDPGYFVQLHLQKISDMHLKSNYTADWGGHGNILYVKIFSIIAGFILVIACINFINLSLSQSPLRAKEIGIRKVLGANRNMLIYQYLGESLILTLIAMLIGIVCVELLLPSFNTLTGKSLSINLLQDPVMFAGLIAIALFTGIFAGSYPAFVLSGYQPVKTLKGKLTNTRSGIKLRQFLVVMQFTLAVGLIISTIIISKQINLIKNIDLGYQKDHIVRFNTRGKVNSDFLSFKEEILKIPGVESVTTSSISPVNIVSSGYGLAWKGMPEEEERQHLVHTIRVSYDFFKTFNIKFKEGRSFSNEHSSDSLNYICNSKLLELIGEEGRLGMELAYYREEYGDLIGIIEDFHFKSLFKEIEPLLITLEDASNLTDAYIRINPNGISNTLKSIEEVWKQYESHSPLEYTFLDEHYDKLYKSEFRMEKIFRFFAVLAIFISCLGLFGLVSYSSTCRIKEMGIRKVYGATAQDIIGLLLSKFGILILISNILAWIPTWYLMNNWLQNFAFRIDISFTSFLAATILTSGIAFITTSYHAIKAAVSNPMESLHYE